MVSLSVHFRNLGLGQWARNLTLVKRIKDT